MLTEIAKLDAVRAAGLPDAAKASSQRPQATLVTQPKIAAPCEDGPGDTAERPFGFGWDGQPAEPGVAPDRRVRARSLTSLITQRHVVDGTTARPAVAGSGGTVSIHEPQVKLKLCHGVPWRGMCHQAAGPRAP